MYAPSSKWVLSCVVALLLATSSAVIAGRLFQDVTTARSEHPTCTVPALSPYRGVTDFKVWVEKGPALTGNVDGSVNTHVAKQIALSVSRVQTQALNRHSNLVSIATAHPFVMNNTVVF